MSLNIHDASLYFGTKIYQLYTDGGWGAALPEFLQHFGLPKPLGNMPR
jgi:hypothetical protein